MRTWLSVSMALALAGTTVACNSRDNENTGGNDAGNTNTSGDDAGNTNTGGDDAGNTNTGSTVKATVAGAVQNPSSYKDVAVEIDNAVVVAAYSYAGSSGGQIGTFYVQDQGGSPGLAVYHSGNDSTSFPAVGDVVNVVGRLANHSGSLQIASSTKYNIALSVTKTGTGTASAGAYPPAGSPTQINEATGYDHASTNAHPEQVGQVLQFTGALTVTDTHPAGFVTTPSSADGGSPKPVGFQLSNGVWVDDSNVYYDCIKGLDGGAAALNLQNGITGVWDRYQDFYAGTAQNPAPTYPVLVPFSCQDIGQ